MSTPDPERAVERGADELEERIDKLDGSIDDAKQKQTEHKAKDPGPLDEDDADGTGDAGDDHGGFDDPEAEEEEEEDK